MKNELKNQIIKEYVDNINVSIIDLSKKYHLGTKTIKKFFIENNIKLKDRSLLIKRKYSCNDKFFDNPQDWTPDVAYFFGWICSDGFVGKNNEVGLRLSEIDIDILLKFKDLIKYDGPIQSCKRKTNKVIILGKECNASDRAGLVIANSVLADSLRLLGIDNRKTSSLNYPEWINESLVPHFLKGYFEGDGTFVKGSRAYYIELTGNKQFIIKCQEVIEITLDITGFLYQVKNSNTYKFRITGTYQPLKFLNWIYQNNEIVLNRKYKKYIEFIDNLSSNPKIHSKTKKELLNYQNKWPKNASE